MRRYGTAINFAQRPQVRNLSGLQLDAVECREFHVVDELHGQHLVAHHQVTGHWTYGLVAHCHAQERACAIHQLLESSTLIRIDIILRHHRK